VGLGEGEKRSVLATDSEPRLKSGTIRIGLDSNAHNLNGFGSASGVNIPMVRLATSGRIGSFRTRIASAAPIKQKNAVVPPSTSATWSPTSSFKGWG